MGKDLDSNVRKNLPLTLRYDFKNKCFLIYNKTEKEYIQITEELKVSHFIVFIYNLKKQSLEINNYHKEMNRIDFKVEEQRRTTKKVKYHIDYVFL